MSQTLKQRMILDHHTKQRQAAIKREEKRQAAIEFLGLNWVFHPKNPNKPRKGTYNNFGLQVME
jgi:hypothetical protein